MKQLLFARWSRGTVAVVIFSLSVAVVRAEDGVKTNSAAAAVVTLDALVAETLEKNPELKFYEAEIAAAKAGRKSAGLLANPEVSGSIGQKRIRGASFSDEGLAWSVSLMQPFEWPGRLSLRKAIANRDIELAQLGYDRFKVALEARVRTLGYGLFAAHEKAAASSEVAERFKALRQVLVQRDPAGLTPMLETRIIEATEVNAARKAGEATIAAQAALLELNQLRGVPTDTRISVGPTQLTFAPIETVDSLATRARTNSYDVRVRAVELAQQGFRFDLARNERYPAISVGPMISDESVKNDRERIVSVGVSIPLPLWNRNTGNIEAAKARQAQAETSLYVTQRDAERALREAAVTYETRLRDISNWRSDAIQHFKEAAEVADRHYRLGAVPVATFVELQKQYLEAVEGLLDTKKEALEAAARIEQLTGVHLPVIARSAEQK